MSFAADKWARALTVGNATAKAVLRALAGFADDEGVCWPSQETLAREVEITSRSVRTALKLLQEQGLISMAMRHRKDGSRASDTIKLHLGAIPKPLVKGVASLPPEGASTPPEGASYPLEARSAPPEGASGHESPLNHQRNLEGEGGSDERVPSARIKPPIELPIMAGEGVVEIAEDYRPSAEIMPLRDPREMLNTEGVAIIQEMTGRPEAMARRLIDHLDWVAYGDANIILACIREAKSRNERDPTMWVEDQLFARRHNRRRAVPLPGSSSMRPEPRLSGVAQNLVELHDKLTEAARTGALDVPSDDPDAAELLLLAGPDDGPTEDSGLDRGSRGARGEDRGVAWASGDGSRPPDALLGAAGFGGHDSGASRALRRRRPPGAAA